MPTLTFLGAARTVTGSKHLIDVDGRRVLIDCGLFQGLKDLRLRNWSPLPIAPDTVDAVVLTHAHLDHCGWLPRLVSQGFKGPVYCTGGTLDLCRLVLPDALMTRGRPEWQMRYNPATLAMIECDGWRQEDIVAMREELGHKARAARGQSGMYWWSFPAAR